MTRDSKGATAQSATQNIACVGFALLLLIDLFALWGGLPLTTIGKMELSDILVVWAIPHILTMSLVFFTLARFSAKFKRLHINRYTLFAATIMLLGALLLVFQGVSGSTAPWLMTVSAIMVAIGSACLLAMWEFIFVSFTDEQIVRTVLLAMLLSSASYLVASSIPPSAQLYLFPVLIIVAASLLIVAYRRSMDLSSVESTNVATRISQSNPSLPSLAQTVHHKPQLLSIARLVRDPLLCVIAIMFAIAITRTVTLFTISDANLINIAGCIGALLSGAILYAARYVLSGALGSLRSFNMLRFYRVLFPTLTTVLLLLPIFGNQLSLLVSSLVFVGYMVAFVLILPTCMTLARQDATHPLAVLGVFMGGVNLVFALATAFAVFLYQVNYFGAATLTVGILLALYVLAMTYTVALNAWRRREQEDKLDYVLVQHYSASDIEQEDLSLKQAQEPKPILRKSGKSRAKKQLTPAPTVSSSAPEGLLATIIKIVSDYQLTGRERDVLLLLAQGRDVPTIAKQLFISENTVRTHTKNIYIKLDIHSKQELLDRVEEYNGNER